MRKFLLSFFMIASFAIINAQVGPYTFSVQSQPYQYLTGSTSLNQGMTWDDPSFMVPVGFNIPLLYDTTNLLYFASYGGALVSGTSGIVDLILPYDVDIIDRGYITGTSVSPISYMTSGSAGNQITKIEWQNVGFYNEYDQFNTLNDSMNFQLWIYENGDLEYRFGDNYISSNYDPYDGLSGALIGAADSLNASTGEFNLLYYLFGQPSNPTVKSVDLIGISSLTTTLNGSPQSGTVYRLHKPGVGIESSDMDLFLTVNPTLATDRISVNWNLEHIPTANITILDIQGRIQYNNSLPSGSNEIDISNFTPGTYLMIVEANKIFRTAKFVKQ